MNLFGPEISLSIIWTPNGNSEGEASLYCNAGNDNAAKGEASLCCNAGNDNAGIGMSLSSTCNIRRTRVDDCILGLIVQELKAAGLTVARNSTALCPSVGRADTTNAFAAPPLLDVAALNSDNRFCRSSG